MRYLPLVLVVSLLGCGAGISSSYSVENAMVDRASVVNRPESPVVRIVLYEGALVDGGESAYLRSDVDVEGKLISITPKMKHSTERLEPGVIRKRSIDIPVSGLTPGKYTIRVIDKAQSIEMDYIKP